MALLAAPLRASPSQGADNGLFLTLRVLGRLHPQEVALRKAGEMSWRRASLDQGVLRMDRQPTRHWDGGNGPWQVRVGSSYRLYPGDLSVGPAPDGPELELLLRISLEDYVAGAAASEGGVHPRPAFALALACVVRQYALQHRGRHGHYDLCDLTHCQLFSGLPHIEAAWTEAARQSQARPLKAGDSSEVLFHGACGGRLESARGAWGDGLGPPPAPALDVLDGRVLCRQAHFFRWQRRIPRGWLAVAGAAALGLDPRGLSLADAEICARSAGGRAHLVRLTFTNAAGIRQSHQVGQAELQSQYGRRYGWDSFLSADFDARWQGDEWVLDGRGVGHGVGLCMEGAREMAELGYNGDEILEHYFPGRFTHPH
jgi:stage II sporulation protein D